MNDSPPEKSNALGRLIIQNTSDSNELKAKLIEIMELGQDFQYDVSNCLKSLLLNSDDELVLLTVKAIAELVKCNHKREIYAQKDFIVPLLDILNKDVTPDHIEVVKHSCRSLGNLCYNCDTARKIILENKGITPILNLLRRTKEKDEFEELTLFITKLILNYTIGGQEFSEDVIQEGLVEIIREILIFELTKPDMNDDLVETVLTILINNDNTKDFLYDDGVNEAVLNVLKNTTNIEISSLCLDLLSVQGEHDSVKTLIARLGGMQMMCTRLEELLQKFDEGDLSANDSDVDAIIKSACDFIIIVLTGDEAMHMLYNKGVGEVYFTMVKWLDSTNLDLLTTAILAMGNFARQDDYCIQLMENKIFDKVLDIFEIYHNFSVRMKDQENTLGSVHPIDPVMVNKIQHASLATLRNLSIPIANKRVAAANGKAAPLLLNALPNIMDHHVAYKLMATIRMLIDGQESVAKQLSSNRSALSCVSAWGHRSQHAGAAGEAPRLLAWAVKLLKDSRHWTDIVQVDGCISCLVNMLVATHSVMQNEAILALTLLAIESLHKKTDADQTTFDLETSFITQLVKAEIGKHIYILIETNLSKMPVEVAENLIAYLDITCKRNELTLDYSKANVHTSLRKFKDARNDFSEDLKTCIDGVVDVISDSGKTDQLQEAFTEVNV